MKRQLKLWYLLPLLAVVGVAATGDKAYYVTINSLGKIQQALQMYPVAANTEHVVSVHNLAGAENMYADGNGNVSFSGTLVKNGMAVLPTGTGYIHSTSGVITAVSTVSESDVARVDNPGNDSSTTKHGYLPKLDNDPTHFLTGQGTWGTALTDAGAVQKSEYFAKGSILTATGAGVESGLAIGSNAQVLTADSTQPLGVKWATVAATGDVVGPSSATSGYVPRYDGVTGKLLMSSLMYVDDLGNPNIPTGQKYKINGTALAAADVGAVASGAVTTSGLTQATNKLLGRSTASTGAIEEITLGAGFSFAGTTLNFSVAGTGDLVTGPASVTSGTLARFDGTTGKLLCAGSMYESDSGAVEIINATGGSVPSNYLQITGSTANNSNYPGLVFKGGTYCTSYPCWQISNGGLTNSLSGGSSGTYTSVGTVSIASNVPGGAYVQLAAGGKAITVRDTSIIDCGADDVTSYLHIHSAGTLVMHDASDDTTVTLGPVTDGTTTLGVTGTIDATGLKVGGAAVLTAEADTLATVTGRGATATSCLYLEAATAMDLGKDTATNVPGCFRMESAGTNSFSTTFSAGVQTENISYTLPTAKPPSTTQYLSCTTGGVWAWATPTEADTLATVTARGATSAYRLILLGDADVSGVPLELGNDAATNTPGQIKMWGAGANNYSTLLHTGTQTQDIELTLPVNDGDNGQFLQTNGSGVLSWAAATASVTGFTAAETTASPNGAAFVDSLTASAASTNVDAALVPKVAGALLAAIPDGAAAGGNKRGQFALDLQLSRAANTNVANGNYSTLLGGYGGTASGSYSISAGGSANVASGPNAAVLGGDSNTASSNYSTVSGGAANTASGVDSTVTGGNTCTASGAYSRAGGYRTNTDLVGSDVYSGSTFGSGAGDCQYGTINLCVATSATTIAELTTTATAYLALAAEDSYACEITLHGDQTDGSSAFWKAYVTVRRIANTTSLDGVVTIICYNCNANVGDAVTWAPTAWTIVADDANDRLAISITPANTTATRWAATIRYSKINY